MKIKFFWCFVVVKAEITKIQALRVVKKGWKIAVVPGFAFGLEPFFRLSYAASLPQLQEGIRRIAQAVKLLV